MRSSNWARRRGRSSARTISQSVSRRTNWLVEATLRSARAFLLDEVSQAWDTAVAGGAWMSRLALRMRLAGANAAEV
jgi:hypothetical protein